MPVILYLSYCYQTMFSWYTSHGELYLKCLRRTAVWYDSRTECLKKLLILSKLRLRDSDTNNLISKDKILYAYYCDLHWIYFVIKYFIWFFKFLNTRPHLTAKRIYVLWRGGKKNYSLLNLLYLSDIDCYVLAWSAVEHSCLLWLLKIDSRTALGCALRIRDIYRLVTSI